MKWNQGLIDRLYTKACEDANGCWAWTASLDGRGYGQVRVDGKNYRAHRMSYELMVSPIPSGLQLDHLCRNRACINPYHLDPVPGAVNRLRGANPSTQVARHAAVTHCPVGHEYTEDNTYRAPGDRRRACKACKAARAKKRSIV